MTERMSERKSARMTTSMTTSMTAPLNQRVSGVNDFAFKMATVNGTGSASANSLLMQAIFRMGIPVTGKNIFPSNIQGLPTVYEIRVSKDGYTGRPQHMDLVVALNSSTYAKDVASVRPGGCLLYDSSWPLEPELVREGITILGIPFGRMCVDAFQGDRNRTLLRNIVYAGALAALLDIDMDIVGQMLLEKFAKKPKLLDANKTAIRLGYDYAKTHLHCPLPFHAQRMDATRDSIIIDGNTAAALGAVFAGATVGAWYPITPSTSLMEAFKEFCEQYRVDPETGLARYCIIQAEDELAAAGITIGAGWAGARAFTNTSGPGISLMQEFIGLAYYTEIPAVFYDVQRTGPATGMPTRTQQSDLMSLAYASHGDTKHIILFPCDPADCFQASVTAFDLAERFQTPVFVASDLDIGMNDWMCKRLQWDDSYRPDRGKVLNAEVLALSGCGRRRNCRAFASRCAPERGVLRARFRARQARRLHGRVGCLSRSGGSARAQVCHRGDRRSRARVSSSAGRARRHRVAWFLPCGGAGVGGSAARSGDHRRLHAHQGLSVLRIRQGFHRVTQCRIRGRTESRRTAAIDAEH